MFFRNKIIKKIKGVPKLGSPLFFENKINKKKGSSSSRKSLVFENKKNKKNKGVPELGSPWFLKIKLLKKLREFLN